MKILGKILRTNTSESEVGLLSLNTVASLSSELTAIREIALEINIEAELSSTLTAKTTYEGYTIQPYFIITETDGVGWLQNDILHSRLNTFDIAGDISNTYEFHGIVLADPLVGGEYYIGIIGDFDDFEDVGLKVELIRQGSIDNVIRQDYITFSSEDWNANAHSPHISIFDDVDSVADIDNVDRLITRIGNLYACSNTIFNAANENIKGIYNIGHFYTGATDESSYLMFNPSTDEVSIKGGLFTDGTITGGTIQTAESGQRIVISNTDQLKFYDSDDAFGKISATSASINIESSSNYGRLNYYFGHSGVPSSLKIYSGTNTGGSPTTSYLTLQSLPDDDTMKIIANATGSISLIFDPDNSTTTLNSSFDVSDGYKVNSTEIITSARALTNIVNATISGIVTIDGTFESGDGINYLSLATDGELGLTGTARVVKNIYIGANGIKAPGAKPATFVEDGLTGCWEFADATEAKQQSISGTLKIPEEMDITVVPIFNIGWHTAGISAGNCKWQLEYLWISPNQDVTAAAQETLTVVSAASAVIGDGLVLAQFTGIDLPSEIDIAMLWKITRLSGDAQDTIAAVTHVRGHMIKYTSNKLGTAT